jgi:hypothetical protein
VLPVKKAVFPIIFLMKRQKGVPAIGESEASGCSGMAETAPVEAIIALDRKHAIA